MTFNYCDHGYPINSNCPSCALGLICERIDMMHRTISDNPGMSVACIVSELIKALDTVYLIANRNR